MKTKWVVVAVCVGLAALTVLSMALQGVQAEPIIRVSQRGREFQPSRLTVRRGETVEIVNDDGDFTHHAYIDSPNFSFDSADQQPGKSVQIHFNRAGIFDVLCGIHPKMRLSVNVK